MTLESFERVKNDPRIQEIVIVDDCSDQAIFDRLHGAVNGMPKVALYRNKRNKGMSWNKRTAVELASTDWLILFDSDNVLETRYIDAVAKADLCPDTIYMPSFAEPEFDFRRYAGKTYDLEAVQKIIKEPMFNVCMNTCNYVVHRDNYREAFTANPEMKGTDTIWMNYNWLIRGGKFKIVEGMAYFHRVHSGSGFVEDMDYNMKQAEAMRRKIKSAKLDDSRMITWKPQTT